MMRKKFFKSKATDLGRYERPSDGFRGAFGRLTRNRIINIPAKSEIGRLSQYSDGP